MTLKTALTCLTIKLKCFIEDDWGGSMVEFAIAAGLIVTPVLLGIMEFGLAAWSKNSVTADAREGARYAVVHGSSSSSVATVDSVRRFVKQRTNLPTTGVDSVRVYASWPTNNDPGSIVQVSVAHRVSRRGPFVPTHTDSVTSKMVILF